MRGTKTIKMFKDGRWVKWDGSDVKELIISEIITAKEFKQNYPKKYKEWNND